MLLLVTTNDAVRLTSGSTQILQVHASYVDTTPGTPPTQTPGNKNTQFSTTTPANIVSPPGSTVSRNIKLITITNTDATTACTVLIQHTVDGSNWFQVAPQVNLLPGYTFTFTDQAGWILVDKSGGRVETPLVGRFLGRTVLTAASANFTTQASTNTLALRGVAGGGGGGGVSAAAASGAGGGGGSGSYLEKTVAVSPNTAYAYTCGALGAGSSGAAGGNGGNSTFVVGATTYTCNGGTGGPLDTSGTVAQDKLGGAGGTVSTNGDLNAIGQSGQPGNVLVSGTSAISGTGGNSQFGAGGNGIAASGTGNAAGGFGAGGSGGLSLTAAARTGGSGTAGCWVVEEYS